MANSFQFRQVDSSENSGTDILQTYQLSWTNAGSYTTIFSIAILKILSVRIAIFDPVVTVGGVN